jgi:GntR family transcriptional regulator, transcriptional repressor for pyruvate dehydrogenase complex
MESRVAYMNFEPINNETVVNEVLKRISTSIIRGELKPGDKLPTEVELIEQFGVGRNSIREAIKMLTAMGVLEIKRGSGTFVATKVSSSMFNPLIFSMIIEPKSGQDLYELRMMFESMVLLIAMDKAEGQDVKAIEGLMEEVKAAFEGGTDNIEYFVESDIKFHNQLLKATHNPLIERIGTTINEIFPAYIRKSIMQRNGIERSIKNHSEILSIIKAKERARVFEIVEKTLEEWKNSWKEE